MAVGLPLKVTYADGDVYSASDINDTNGTINANVKPYAAGANKIINGAFNVWQRGTSASLTNNTFAFGPDRYRAYVSFSAGTASFSQQTFTAGTAPVAGYESAYFARVTCGSTSTYMEMSQKIEDVRTFAGQTATFSFWAKASAALTMIPGVIQQFGSGGSADVSTQGSSFTLSTSWTRYSFTLSIPSITGKTIGTGSDLLAFFYYSSGTLNSATIDTWGWQLESGSTATAFQTASGSIGGELALCQRYYYRAGQGDSAYTVFGSGQANGLTVVAASFSIPVTMRVAPTSVDYSTLRVRNNAVGVYNAITAAALDSASNSRSNPFVSFTTSGASGGLYYDIQGNNSTSAYIAFSAEL